MGVAQISKDAYLMFSLTFMVYGITNDKDDADDTDDHLFGILTGIQWWSANL